MNCRMYQGYKPEDFIGKISTVCSAGSNTNVEYIAMKRFYIGYLDLGFNKICCCLFWDVGFCPKGTSTNRLVVICRQKSHQQLTTLDGSGGAMDDD